MGIRFRRDKGEPVIEIDADFRGRVKIRESHRAGQTETEIVVTPPSTPSDASEEENGRFVGFAVLSLVFLAIALASAYWLFTRGPKAGPQFDSAYYIIAVVIGIMAAFALFGCMRSYAKLTGKHGSFYAEVGGPAALFLLVIIGAHYFVRSPTNFTLIIRLSGDIDPTAVEGEKVIIDLDGRREQPAFSTLGEAEVRDVSTSLTGTSVHVALTPGRLHLRSSTATIPSDHIIYLDVTVDPPLPPVPPAPVAEVCEPTTDGSDVAGTGKYKVVAPFIFIPAMHEMIYAHQESDGSVKALMEYRSPMTSKNDYDSFQAADFRQCLDRCTAEEPCEAVAYFESNRACHLLGEPLEACVVPSKRPTYFARKLRKTAS